MGEPQYLGGNQRRPGPPEYEYRDGQDFQYRGRQVLNKFVLRVPIQTPELDYEGQEIEPLPRQRIVQHEPLPMPVPKPLPPPPPPPPPRPPRFRTVYVKETHVRHVPVVQQIPIVQHIIKAVQIPEVPEPIVPQAQSSFIPLPMAASAGRSGSCPSGQIEEWTQPGGAGTDWVKICVTEPTTTKPPRRDPCQGRPDPMMGCVMG